MSRFNNKSILVTGGTSGIGLATAERLASEGARVAVTGSRQESLDRFGESHPNIPSFLIDNAKAGTEKVLADRIKSEFGAIDGAFLNAGYGTFSPVAETEAEDFDQQFAVNVRGPLLQARALSPLMNDGGSLVLTTSVVQQMGMEGGAVYSASKGALRPMVRVMAREFAPRNIRVNAVSPGPIGTDFFNRTNLTEDQTEQMAEGIQSQVPLGRFGEAREVAAVATFLLSDDASYVTGSEYVVDGGMSEL